MELKRNGTIDFWKFIFCFWIVLFHIGYYKGYISIATGGSACVEFFFLVSGYLMANSMERERSTDIELGKRTISFLIRKVRRFYPYFLFTWIFSFVITHWGNGISIVKTFEDLLESPYQLMLLQMAGFRRMGHTVWVSWYISAMIISMLILYPLRFKWRDSFDWIVGPVLGLCMAGYAYNSFSRIPEIENYEPQFLLYSGVIRAMAEIALGCTCYSICEGLKRISFKKGGEILLTIIEFGGYIGILLATNKWTNSNKDLVWLLIFMVSITISFSQKGLLSKYFNNRISYYLGKFSMPLFLVHLEVLLRWKFDFGWTDEQDFLMYIIAIFLTTVLCLWIGELWNKNSSVFWKWCQSWILEI